MELEIPPIMSVEDYLNFEDPSGQRYEYNAGRLIAMAGGTAEHSFIGVNVVRAIANRLSGSGCIAFNSDLRIRIPRKPRYCYPDGGVVCGKPEYEKTSKQKKIALLNPKVIVEVLSEDTELLDRGQKFTDYRSIESFRQYVLIAQDAPRIETFLRQEDGSWKFNVFEGIGAVAKLESLGIEIPLSEIYENIEFAADDVEMG